MIVECNVWCVGNSKELIELGLPEGDSWMPIAIDFSIVVAIKLCGSNEFIGDDKAVIYFDGNYLIVDLTYIRAIDYWKEAKGKPGKDFSPGFIGGIDPYKFNR